MPAFATGPHRYPRSVCVDYPGRNHLLGPRETIMRITIVAGLITSVALAEAQGQSVRVWGDNTFGQCDVPADLGPVITVAAGGHHTLALRADGSVVGWGAGGVNSGVDPHFGQSIVPPGLTGVVSISAGARHSVALLSNGTVRCWGLNDSGQCNVPAGLGPVRSISAGGYHTVVQLESNDGVPAGPVRCWGSNTYGQCNVPTSTLTAYSIAAGGFHTVVSRPNTYITAWGRNNYNQATVPNYLVGEPVPYVVAGLYHSIAGKFDNRFAAWGKAHEGQTGGSLNTLIRSISAGWYHNVAILADGTVRCWGSNSSGQSTVPAGLFDPRVVAAGGAHSVAVLGPQPPDKDNDGIFDAQDNCPGIHNPNQADCDGDGIGDACDSPTEDYNGNGLPDYCECIADLFVDQAVDGIDLGVVLAYWGPTTSSQVSQRADLNRDGFVDGADLGYLLSRWGPCTN
jgi:alpha-tubulin suppressor-like RCC1 family protein